jgi:hypothetical protein
VPTYLKQLSPDTVTAIEKAPEQPLDYGQAILEVESVAKTSLRIKPNYDRVG